MKTLVALLLIGAGVWIFHTGWMQRSSLKGKAQAALASAVRRLDGETRVPEHSWYMIAGGVSVLAGIGLVYAGRGR